MDEIYYTTRYIYKQLLIWSRTNKGVLVSIKTSGPLPRYKKNDKKRIYIKGTV